MLLSICSINYMKKILTKYQLCITLAKINFRHAQRSIYLSIRNIYVFQRNLDQKIEMPFVAAPKYIFSQLKCLHLQCTFKGTWKYIETLQNHNIVCLHAWP